MTRPLRRLRKRTTKPVTTIFNQPGRPKIHISTIAAVFSRFDDRRKQINLMFNNPWSEEAMKANRLNLIELEKRLDDFCLSHRFDFKSYFNGGRYALDDSRKKRP